MCLSERTSAHASKTAWRGWWLKSDTSQFTAKMNWSGDYRHTHHTTYTVTPHNTHTQTIFTIISQFVRYFFVERPISSTAFNPFEWIRLRNGRVILVRTTFLPFAPHAYHSFNSYATRIFHPVQFLYEIALFCRSLAQTAQKQYTEAQL